MQCEFCGKELGTLIYKHDAIDGFYCTIVCAKEMLDFAELYDYLDGNRGEPYEVQNIKMKGVVTHVFK